jgi:hypothetical protein
VDQERFDALVDALEAVDSADDVTWVEAVVALYEQEPSYSVLHQGLCIHRRYQDLVGEARQLAWTRLRPYLAGADDRFAEPIVHALWEDFFHDPMEAEVWAAIVGERRPLEEQLLERLLPASGPVAPALKYPLYERLIEESPGRWDPAIYAGLMNAFDWYSLRIDEPRADAILRRMSLPPGAARAYAERLELERRRRSG